MKRHFWLINYRAWLNRFSLFNNLLLPLRTFLMAEIKSKTYNKVK